MQTIRAAALGLGVAWACACATTNPAQVSETRMTFHPAREAACALDVVPADMWKMRPGGEWEVIGYVTLSDAGAVDPLSEKARAQVWPRACRMGGEAVTVFLSSQTESEDGVGSGTIYGVLRRPM